MINTAKISAPPMVYISGEEMTREVMKLVLAQWVAPYVDTKQWQEFDLSCKSRDNSKDQVLKDAIAAGTAIGAIFKEPTITPTAEQKVELGLTTTLGSPNGKMREAWNGYSIDRDTIHIPGLESQLGYKKPVLFCRHAVGGEYSAGFAIVGPGDLELTHTAADGTKTVINKRALTDKTNAAVVYHNPLDNVEQLAHHFFKRTLEAGVTPSVVTKKTVFKWQEPFWQKMKEIFDRDYKAKFAAKGLLDSSGGQLSHVISDDASMKVLRWRDGGFGMVAHNYDGDWLTDEISQIHKSPGFISSALTGVKANGQKIMEFEASHGTIADQYLLYKAGKETSVNPLGLVFALRGAIDHSAALALENKQIDAAAAENIRFYTASMYSAMCEAMADGKGTRDLSGPKGLTTQDFVKEVAGRLQKKMSGGGKRAVA